MYYLIQLCPGGAISPTSLRPRCRLVSVSLGDFFYYICLYTHVMKEFKMWAILIQWTCLAMSCSLTITLPMPPSGSSVLTIVLLSLPESITLSTSACLCTSWADSSAQSTSFASIVTGIQCVKARLDKLWSEYRYSQHPIHDYYSCQSHHGERTDLQQAL